MKMKKIQLLGIFLALFWGATLSAQGFQQIYDLNGPGLAGSRIIAVSPTPDGGYVFYGTASQTETYLVKTDPDGAIVWSKPFTVSSSDDPVADLFVLPNGHYALGVYIEATQTTSTVLIFDGMGNLLQQRSFSGLTRMCPTVDGFFVVNRTGNQSMLLRRLDTTLNSVWEKTLATSRMLFMPDMITTSDGGVCVLAAYDSLPNNPNSPKLIKADADGNKQWEREYTSSNFTYFGALTQTPSGDYVLNTTDGVSSVVIRTNSGGTLLWSKEITSSLYYHCLTPDGGIALAGTDVNQFQPNLTKLNSAGTVVFSRNFTPNTNGGELFHIRPTPDQGLVLCGYAIDDAFMHQGLLVKTDASGNIYTNFIRGQAYFDQNHNCMANAGEPALAGWVITAIESGQTFVARTDDAGFYEINLPPGSYAVQIHSPGPLWDPCNNGLYNISVISPADTAEQDFPVKDLALCALLDLSIATPFLRRCFDAVYEVSWCNQGTYAANNAAVQIVLPPQLDYVSSTLPVAAQTGDTLWFDIGNVGFSACGDFQLKVNINCDSTVLGQTLCTAARIYPDTLCVHPANWSGAHVKAAARCAGDTIVEFTLKNIGTAPTNTLDYIITEDHVVLLMGAFNLAPGEQMFIQRPANGATQRIQANQAPNYPFASMPSAAIEGCGGFSSLGFIGQYTLDDGDPFTDIDCQEVRGSFDPNDKRGFPTGYGTEHWIEPETEITYLIRFQNTGTDTAFYVEVRDTLSAWLDPATLHIGAASHPFNWNVQRAGALSFRFDHILLPDSNVNEPASHGFIQFKIRPKADVPLNTVVENTACIYFDFNAPVVTNTSWHRLGRDFYTVVSVFDRPGTLPVTVQPNPFRQRAQLVLPENATGQYRYQLYDAGGRILCDQAFSGPRLELDAAGLRPGVYWFALREKDGTLVAQGKMECGL